MAAESESTGQRGRDEANGMGEDGWEGPKERVRNVDAQECDLRIPMRCVHTVLFVVSAIPSRCSLLLVPSSDATVSSMVRCERPPADDLARVFHP